MRVEQSVQLVLMPDCGVKAFIDQLQAAQDLTPAPLRVQWKGKLYYTREETATEASHRNCVELAKKAERKNLYLGLKAEFEGDDDAN